MFKRIGEFITKRPWAVVAIWVILLLVSLPLIGVFMQNLDYDTAGFIPKDLGAYKAKDKHDLEFPSENDNNILIVVDSSNKTSAMLFIDRINDTIRNDTALKNVTGTSSIYDLHREALVNMTPELHEGLHDFYENATDGNRELYEGIDGVLEANRELYWLKDNVSDINNGLYKAHKAVRDANGMLYSQRDQIVAMNNGLYQIKAGDPNMTDDDVINTFMAMQGMTSPQDRAMVTAVYGLGQSPADPVIDGFVLNMASQALPEDQRISTRDIYYLGRNPSSVTIENYVIGKASAGRNETESKFIRDVWNLGDHPLDADYNKFVLNKACEDKNESERKNITEIWNLGENASEKKVTDYVLGKALDGLNETESESLMEIYSLGRNASNDTIRNYVVSKVAKELNLTGNTTYFATLLNMDRNVTDESLDTFATDWAFTHGYTDPQIFPDSVVNSLASGDVALYIVTTSDSPETAAAVDAVRIIRADIAGIQSEFPDVKAYVTGTAAMSLDAEGSAMADVNNIDKISVLLILILLGLYFRSFLTPFVPLVIIGIAIVASFGMMGLISTQIDIYYLVMTFMMVIMLGAGTDYCVFMLSRYSEERSGGADVKDAVRTAVSHAGKSIASSGTTAMIGFSALMLIDQGIFRSIGLGTAVGILMSMLIAVTLVPAVLTIAGDRLFWPRKIYNTGNKGLTSGIWKKITGAVIKNARIVIVLAILLTIPSIAVFSQLSLGNDFVAMMPPGIESKVGFDIIDEEFGSGAFNKAMIVMTMPIDLKDSSGNYTDSSLDQVEHVSAMIAGIQGVDKVYSITRPEGATISYKDISSYSTLEEEYYKEYMKNNTGYDGKTTLIYFSLVGSPYSDQSRQTIDKVRAVLADYENGEGKGTQMLLGGSSVGMFEYQKLCTDKYGIVIPIVLVGIFIVLMVLLRSVFTPLRLIFTLLMSIFWTLAAFILVFQFWMAVSITWILPIMLFCVLMGLGVDYDIFLVSRIREEVLKGMSDEEAITHAVEATGTIITLCGAVMAAAFGSMMISDMLELKEFGFVLFLAIILDATVMRMIVVPSIMVLMKKYNWWMPGLSQPQKKE